MSWLDEAVAKASGKVGRDHHWLYVDAERFLALAQVVEAARTQQREIPAWTRVEVELTEALARLDELE